VLRAALHAGAAPGLALAALVLAGCSGGSAGGGSAVAVSPPAVPAGARSACERLAAALPDRLGDIAARRAVTPSSPYTAAWGDPPIVLRCGAAPPRHPYTGDRLTIDGVSWLGSHQGDVQAWASLGRPVTVRLDVPLGYDEQDAILADLSAVLAAAVPARRSPAPGASG